MANVRNNLAGKNVYGAGSHAPTKGAVSANGVKGYLARTMRQKAKGGNVSQFRSVGADGQSDTRSGAAARLAQNAFGSDGGRHTATPVTPFAGAVTGQGGNGGARGGHKNAAAKLAAQQAMQQAQAAAIPTVTISANGQLELPYSSDWSADLLSGLQDSNSDLANLQAQQQAESAQYTADNQTAATNYDTQKKATTNAGASSGLGFSSSYGNQVAQDGTDYQSTINTLLAQHQAQQTAFDTQRTAIVNAFKQQLQQNALNLADSTATQAGTLGYGAAKAKNNDRQKQAAAKFTATAVKSKGKKK